MADTRPEREAVSDRAARGRRDDSLRRVRSVTKGIAVAAVAAVGALSLYVSKALPGHSATPNTAATTTPTTTAPAASSSGSSGSQSSSATTSPTVTAPPSPPVTTQQPVHATSGAS